VNCSSNPQPPPLTAEEKAILESDKIGDTAYSKKWVLSVLLHMMEDEKSSGDCHDASDGNDVSDYNGPTNGAEKDDTDAKDSELELNRKDETNQIKQSLEEELCELWDMTMDSDVSKYLVGENAIDLILEVILNAKSLRKLEICMGILANMACTKDVCKIMVEHPRLSEITLFHIDNPDVRTLTELARLVTVCLSHKEVRRKWIDTLQSRSVVNKLVFILENSLNVELLDGVADLIDQLIDYDDGILEDLSSERMVTIICDVYRRTAVRHPQTVQTLLHILQLISTTVKGVSALVAVKDSGEIAEIILVQGSKYFTPLESNFPSLVSSCCILNVLMSADKEAKKEFHKKDLKILLTTMSLIDELSQNSKDNDDRCNTFKTYSEAVMDFLIVLVEQFIHAEVSENTIKKLKERERQIARIVSLLKRIPEYSSPVKQLVDVLLKNDILSNTSSSEVKLGSSSSDCRRKSTDRVTDTKKEDSGSVKSETPEKF